MKVIVYPEPWPDLVKAFLCFLVWFSGCVAPAFVLKLAASGMLVVLGAPSEQPYVQVYVRLQGPGARSSLARCS